MWFVFWGVKKKKGVAYFKVVFFNSFWLSICLMFLVGGGGAVVAIFQQQYFSALLSFSTNNFYPVNFKLSFNFWVLTSCTKLISFY